MRVNTSAETHIHLSYLSRYNLDPGLMLPLVLPLVPSGTNAPISSESKVYGRERTFSPLYMFGSGW
jgi:hypothetical protein